MDDKKFVYTIVDEKDNEYEIRDRRIDEGLVDINIDLSDYATKEFVNNAISNFENYDDTALSERVSSLESIDHSIFLTEHQPLDGYIRKEEYDKLVEEVLTKADASVVEELSEKVDNIEGVITFKVNIETLKAVQAAVENGEEVPTDSLFNGATEEEVLAAIKSGKAVFLVDENNIHYTLASAKVNKKGILKAKFTSVTSSKALVKVELDETSTGRSFDRVKSGAIEYSENELVKVDQGTEDKKGNSLVGKVLAVSSNGLMEDFISVYTKDEVNALIAADAIDSAEKLQAAFDAGTPYIKLAGNVAGNFIVPETAECTLDLGHFKIENDGDHTITVNGKLTICGDGIIDNLTHTKAPLVINGTVILQNGMITRSLENGQNDKDPGGNSYYAILNHGKFYMYGGKVIANGKYSSVIDNGWYTPSENLTRKNAECYIYNGILDGGLNTLKNDDYGVMKLYGGIIGINSYKCAILNWNVLDIYSGVIGTGSSGENYSVITKGDRSLGYEDGTTNVYGGTFIGTLRQEDELIRYNKFGLYKQ